MTVGDPTKVNLRHLRAFALVAETGTVRAAAEMAGLSQPAVTQGLARLELHFGCSLFHRGHSGMRLSDDGMVLHARVIRLLGFLDDMKTRINAARRGRRGDPIERMVSMVQLQTLIAVADARGFAAAGRRMHVAEPTVHRAARELEKLVDVPLFQSVSYGVEMTPVGREAARLASLALKELETAREELTAAAGFRGGRVVIGSLPLARTEILPEAIACLYDDEPSASVEVLEGPYQALMHLLRKGEIDLIIGALRDPPPHADVLETALFEDDLSVIARAEHPLTRLERVTVEDLAGFPWAAPRKETPTRRHFDMLLSGHGAEVGLVETSSMVIIRALLLKSDRLTLLSRRQIMYEEQQGLLVALPFELPFTRRAIGFTTRLNWQPTKLQKLLLEHLRRISGELVNDG